MLGRRLFILQRASAAVLAPLVMLHLVVIIIATQGGLDAAEILSRTRGSILWAAAYGLFVAAAAIHAAIGLRVIACETFGGTRRFLDLLTFAVALVLATLGLRAVYAVIA